MAERGDGSLPAAARSSITGEYGYLRWPLRAGDGSATDRVGVAEDIWKLKSWRRRRGGGDLHGGDLHWEGMFSVELGKVREGVCAGKHFSMAHYSSVR